MAALAGSSHAPPCDRTASTLPHAPPHPAVGAQRLHFVMSKAFAAVNKPRAYWELARASVSAWIDDFAPSMGAAISYYTVFSIAPLLLIIIGIAGLVFGHDAAAGRIYAEVEGFVGAEGATAIQGMVKSASAPKAGVIGTIVGIVLLLVGATTVFAELESALDRIWRTPAPKSEGLWALIRARVMSFGLILTVGFLLLVSLVVSAGLAALGTWWAPLFGGWEVLLQVVNFVVSLGIVIVLFAAIYKWLPRATIGWRDVWIGAAVTGVLFTVGKLLIGVYIGKAGVASGFGAAGSLVVILVWVYYSAQIFLLGAEFTWLYAYRLGSRQGEAPPAADASGSKAAPTRAQNDGAPKDRSRPLAARESSGVPILHAPALSAMQWVRVAKAAFLAGRMVRIIRTMPRGDGKRLT